MVITVSDTIKSSAATVLLKPLKVAKVVSELAGVYSISLLFMVYPAVRPPAMYVAKVSSIFHSAEVISEIVTSESSARLYPSVTVTVFEELRALFEMVTVVPARTISEAVAFSLKPLKVIKLP